MTDGPAHLAELNPMQLKAVTTLDGPILVLAGAGSGKTGVLVRRIAHLIHTGVEPEHIFAVTFTNKAAGEMKDRVIRLVGDIGSKVWLSTFHSSSARMLRKDIEVLGYTKKFSIYDDDDQQRIARQLIKDHGLDTKIFPPKDFLSRIDFYKNRMMRPEDVIAQRRAHANDTFMRLWRAYEESLKAADAVDFNDLIGLVVTLLENHPDVLKRWRDTFRYMLVDEYQDTNGAQYRLLRLLASEHQNLCVVGDDDQSIYGFRGADISNILGFQQDFDKAMVIRMEQNYRCSQNILTLANAVVAINTGRMEKKLWTHSGPGVRVQFLVGEAPADEAKLVSQACAELAAKGVAYGDMAVIYRTNATARVFERAFKLRRIPHRVVGGKKFYERREVRDTLAYLRLLVNPADDAAFLRVVNVPARGIGAKTLTKLRSDATARGEPMLKTARSHAGGSSKQAKGLATFLLLIDRLAGRAKVAHPHAVLAELLNESGYRAMLQAEDTRESKQRLTHLAELMKDLASADSPEGTSPIDVLTAWLDRVALTGQDDEIPDGGEIALLTVHSSKGLEFPVVFVVHMMEGIFPHKRSLHTDEGIEEERRLAYVAFTRAKQRLVVTRSRTRGGSYDRRGKEVFASVAPSRFLFQAPESVCHGEVPTSGPDVAYVDPVTEAAETRAEFFASRHSDPPSTPARARKPTHVHKPTRASEPAPRGPSATKPTPTKTREQHHALRSIEALDDLIPLTRVWHAQLGLGWVKRVLPTEAPVQVRVAFGSRRAPPKVVAVSDLRLVTD